MSSLAQRIAQSCILHGEFRLRSGTVSPHYFDKYLFETDPDLLEEVAGALEPLIPTDTDYLAGLELGGVPLATALSLETGLPAIFVRKERKAYGTEKIAEGPPVAGKKLCIIEDVITTGGQALISVEALRLLEATVDTVVSVIVRGHAYKLPFVTAGLALRSLYDIEDILPPRTYDARCDATQPQEVPDGAE